MVDLRSVSKTSEAQLGVHAITISESCIEERTSLILKKCAIGLKPHEATRLAEIDELLEREELKKADLLDALGDERLVRINSGLDRVEQAIRELQTRS